MSVKLVDEYMVGATCQSTQRIILISPHPSSLHQLVGELTAQCYDVMVMHHMNSDLFIQLSPNLLICDQRHMELEQESLASLNELGIPALHLVREQFYGSNDLLNKYVKWPAALHEITSQIVQLTTLNNHASTDHSKQMKFKDLILDFKRLTVTQNNTRIDLTRTEFDLLKVLLEADGAALSRQDLLDAVWGTQYFGGSNTVDVHIKSLRNKLKDDPKAPKYIATIRSIGYRLAD